MTTPNTTPSATDFSRLPLAPAMLAAGLATPAAGAQPVYVRDQVAKTTLERAAEQVAASAQPAQPAHTARPYA